MEYPFTGFFIRDERIRGPSHDGEFYITNNYIYGPFNSGKYYIGASKQNFGPGQSGQFYLRGPVDHAAVAGRPAMRISLCGTGEPAEHMNHGAEAVHLIIGAVGG
jgi:hypothetical protein